MSETAAIVDATRHSPSNPVDLQVAGLGMLERTIRLAAVTGCDRAVVVGPGAVREAFERVRGRISEDDRFELEVQFLESEHSSLTGVLTAANDAVESVGFERGAYLDSTAVYDRERVGECIDRASRATGVCAPDSDETSSSQLPRFFAADRQTWEQLVAHARRRDVDSVSSLAGTGADAIPTIPVEGEDAPWIRVTDRASGDRAAEHIWNGCYKSVDGPVARHINRHFSLPISRRLAPFDFTPNQVSVGAGLLGLATGPIAAVGGYVALLVAAVVYQIKSIVDGTDGELARAKYEFTDSGAWIDKIFDDLADISFAVGAGIGVWSMGIPGPSVAGTEFWIAVIAVTLIGKLVDSVVFYGHAYRDGELVHPKAIFDWEFEEDEDETPVDSPGAKVLAYLKPISKGDVFIFLALLSAIGGILPVYLALFAVGQVSVGISRVRQARLQQQHRAAARRGETSRGPSAQ